MRKVTLFVIASLLVSLAAQPARAQSIRASVEALRGAPSPALERGRIGVVAAGRLAPSPLRMTLRGVLVALGVVAGLVAGFYIGLVVGVMMEKGPSEDPGLNGALIGAPIGAALGGVVVWKLTK